jgi:hypothetical protein
MQMKSPNLPVLAVLPICAASKLEQKTESSQMLRPQPKAQPASSQSLELAIAQQLIWQTLLETSGQPYTKKLYATKFNDCVMRMPSSLGLGRKRKGALLMKPWSIFRALLAVLFLPLSTKFSAWSASRQQSAEPLLSLECPKQTFGALPPPDLRG